MTGTRFFLVFLSGQGTIRMKYLRNNIRRVIYIFLICCSATQLFWRCDATERGDIFDAPIGLKQNEKIIQDLYIVECRIKGPDIKDNGDALVVRDELFTVSCDCANLSRIISPLSL